MLFLILLWLLSRQLAAGGGDFNAE